MNKLEKLKEAFKEVDFPLSKLAHYSWCTLELGKSYKPSIDMLDDLYCGLVSGVIGNLGTGKTPEYIEGIGPEPEKRHSAEGYSGLWNTLIELGAGTYPYEEWILEHPESEEWAEWIEASLIKENAFNSNPEKWLIEFRKELIRQEENHRANDPKGLIEINPN